MNKNNQIFGHLDGLSVVFKTRPEVWICIVRAMFGFSYIVQPQY